MTTNKPSKTEFINAYTYCYGATRKTAESVYKTATPEYIRAVIDSLKNDAKKAYYDD